MRVLKAFLMTALASSLLLAQTSAPSASSDATGIANAVKKLQNALAEQQKAMTEQQQRIADQQAEIEKLQQQLAGQATAVAEGSEGQSPRLVHATLNTTNVNPEVAPAPDAAAQDRPKESPLSFRIGGAEFTPGGFMDFTTIIRSTNTGNLGTNFFAIPFSNTIAGHLTETRFTAQNSRVSLKATDKFGKNDVTGYLEMDFLGNDASNVFVTSNSHTLRQRLYWVDLRRSKWEVLAGQSWSWLTPNRAGLSPMPADVFFSQNMDFNYQVGLTWTRAPQFRAVYHPNDNWAMGIALENQEQFGGQGEVTFPAAFAAQLGGQIDQANNSAIPNLHPDIIPKIAYDTDLGGKHMHLEAAGLLTTIKTTSLPLGVPNSTFVSTSKTGGGVEAAVNLEVVKNFRLVANGFYSDGGGRYIFGMGPDAVALPSNAAGQTCTNVATTAGNPPVTTFSGVGCQIALSLVHSGSSIVGFEAQVTPRTMFYGYYGGAYFQRNFAPDLTGRPGTFAGFGGPNSANTNNRAIQEPTLGWIQTFWKDPQHGALLLITQASYLTRAPWFVAAGAPKNAHLTMGWVDLRYVLP